MLENAIEWDLCDTPGPLVEKVTKWVEVVESPDLHRRLAQFVWACRETEEHALSRKDIYGPRPTDILMDINDLILSIRVWTGYDLASHEFTQQHNIPTLPVSMNVRAAIFKDILYNPFLPAVTLPAGEKCGKCEGTGWTVAYAPIPEHVVCDSCHGTGHGPSPVLTPLVRSLAETAYRERREDGTLDQFRLGLLSDALIDAGLDEVACPACDGDGSFEWGLWKDIKVCSFCHGTGRQPQPLLAHLLSEGPHWRGCWAVDLLTGRG